MVLQSPEEAHKGLGLRALGFIRGQGLVRRFGVQNFGAWGLIRVLGLSGFRV